MINDDIVKVLSMLDASSRATVEANRLADLADFLKAATVSESSASPMPECEADEMPLMEGIDMSLDALCKEMLRQRESAGFWGRAAGRYSIKLKKTEDDLTSLLNVIDSVQNGSQPLKTIYAKAKELSA